MTPSLQTCIDMACAAVTNWENGDHFHDHPVIIAAATPLSSRVVRANGWGHPRGYLDHRKLTDAINSPPTDRSSAIIFEQAALLLGSSGIAEFNQVRTNDQIPMAVVLVPDRATTAWMVVGVPKPKLN